ncbi:PIR Superfamily Protein [Plasmodium ovale wallikeri]|uniref:PIR Superfamily Protein n=2 Tax=Plasmodium ovale TaxID=36330 RepID=A0A1A8YNP5_PLAOA|nr:PIR Superfamily Protein [Plasmodium ovale wallikeri]SBT58894.1 PIR Superfamily Protein [Plasmodium ovale wallikeri]SBT73359.1 PIR protein [Plasmodium ovale]
MADISTSDFPSKNLYKILEESIDYNDINDYINNEGYETYAVSWSTNLQTKLESFLKSYISHASNDDHKKRCRDVFHILDDLIRKIKKSDNSEDLTYVEEAINNCIVSYVPAHGCDTSFRISVEDENIIENRKKIDDFMEDTIYINNKIEQINLSANCTDIRNYVETQKTLLNLMLTHDNDKYADILTFYGKSRNDKLDDIIVEITCNSSKQDGDVAIPGNSGESGASVGQISISLVFSLLGILIISFFSYNFTPFGPWLNTTLRKKNIFLKKFNAEENHEMLEDIPGFTHTSVRNKGYNMLYHSLEE